MVTARGILTDLHRTGRLRRASVAPYGRPMSPLSPEMEARVAQQTARLSRDVVPGVPFDDWLRMNDKNPAFARDVLRALGNPLPEFPLA